MKTLLAVERRHSLPMRYERQSYAEVFFERKNRTAFSFKLQAGLNRLQKKFFYQPLCGVQKRIDQLGTTRFVDFNLNWRKNNSPEFKVLKSRSFE